MDYPICVNCNCPILFTGEKVTMDGRVACACICKRWNMNITYSNSTTASTLSDWTKNLNAMRDWNVTFHGTFDGPTELFNRFFEKPVREPVPDAFQDAFRDGELEL